MATERKATLADVQAKLVAAQQCHPNAVQPLISEALDAIDAIARQAAPSGQEPSPWKADRELLAELEFLIEHTSGGPRTMEFLLRLQSRVKVTGSLSPSVQEPVAWMARNGNGVVGLTEKVHPEMLVATTVGRPVWQPLYPASALLAERRAAMEEVTEALIELRDASLPSQGEYRDFATFWNPIFSAVAAIREKAK